MNKSNAYHQKLEILIILVLFIWTVLVFLPGSYTIDTWMQHREMVNGLYSDWFGGAIPFTWRILWLVTGNYVSLYFLLMVLYWVFFTIMLWDTRLLSIRFWIVIFIAVFFCFIPQLIMRDSLMSICWGIGALLLLRLRQSGNYKLLAFCLLLLFGYGLWAMINATAAFVPIVWAIIIVVRKAHIAAWKHLLFSIGISIFFFFSIQVVIGRVLHINKTYPEYKLKLLDITGISKLSGQNYIPRCISQFPTFNYDTLMKNYTPATFDNIYWPANWVPLVPQPNAALNKCVTQSWVNAIKSHPLLYLQNRLQGFLYYLRIRDRLKKSEYYSLGYLIYPHNPLHLQELPNKVRDGLGNMCDILRATFFFDPWFWLLLNILTFAWLVRKSSVVKDNFYRIHACIQLSGIVFTLSQFPIYQIDGGFRYT